MYHMSTPNSLQDDLKNLNRFLERFWSMNEFLSLSVIVDGILLCSLTVGMQIDVRHLAVSDNSPKMYIIIKRLYERMIDVFRDNTAHAEQALQILQYLTQCKALTNAENVDQYTSLMLCEAILDSAVDGDIKWNVARSVMQLGFRDRRFGFFTGSDFGRICVRFLEHHFAHDPENHDSIDDAFLALSIPNWVNKILPGLLNDGNYMGWICSALKDPSRMNLRDAALRLVSFIADTIGDPQNQVVQKSWIDHGLSSALKACWQNILDDHSDLSKYYMSRYFVILNGLSKSPIWHHFILNDHWETFECADCHNTDWLARLLRGDYARKNLWLQGTR